MGAKIDVEGGYIKAKAPKAACAARTSSSIPSA
jgi:hypothetical protein